MKKEYDFSKGRRGVSRELPPPEDLSKRTKVRITIMLDSDVLEHFKAAATKPGADPYQTQINRALRAYVFAEKRPEDRLAEDSSFIDRVAERVATYVSNRPGRSSRKRAKTRR